MIAATIIFLFTRLLRRVALFPVLALVVSMGLLPRPAEAVHSPVLGYSELFSKDVLSGFALQGFDPVDYFLHGRASSGSSEFESVWKGAAWRFNSAANKAAFDADPEVYAPQFGGYDALMVASGKPVDANPLIFWINSGKLYIFRTTDNRANFIAQQEHQTLAHSRWTSVEKMLNAL
jgi:hypothetical protein